MSSGFLGPQYCHICTFILSPVWIEFQGLQISSLLDNIVNFHLLWQRAFSPEGLSEMWNEMVIDEEITFNREESAHTGRALHPKNWTHMENIITSHNYLCGFSFFLLNRGLHRLFWNSEKGWTQWQRKERWRGCVNICTSLHHWDVGLGTAAR